MDVFGQSHCIRIEVVVFGHGVAKLVYSGKSGCIRVRMVVLGQSCCKRAKAVVLGQSGCIRAKVVGIREKVYVFGQQWL